MYNLPKSDLIKKIEELKKEINKYKYDKLTGLKGKHDFIPKLEEAVKNKNNHWVRLIDINNLHRTNEDGGYIAGDKIILKVVNYLKSTTNEEIFKIGGDEFCIIYESVTLPKQLDCEKIVYATLSLNEFNSYKDLITKLSNILKMNKNKWYKDRNLERRK